jgi:ribosome maturation factor RimP
MNLIEEKLRELVTESVSEEGLTLVDMTLIQQSSGAILRVYADKLGGITVGECARLSRKLEMVIENEGVFERRWILEVSSPGLDRPLKTETEFGLKIGEMIKLYYSDETGNPAELKGKIAGAADNMVTINTDDGQFEIDLAKVSKGQIIL